MNRTTVVLSTALVVLSLGYGVAASVNAAKKKHTLLLGGHDLLKASEVTVTAVGRSTTLKRTGKEYVLSSSFGSAPADAATVTAFLSPWKDIVIERDLGPSTTGQLEQYGITATAPSLGFELDGTRYGFSLGGRSPVAPQAYVFDGSAHKLFLVDGEAMAKLAAATPEYFRMNRVLDTSTAAVTALAWQAGGKTRRFYKEGGDWYIEENGSPYLCEASSVTVLFAALGRLRIADFAPAEAPDSVAGLRATREELSLNVTFSSAAAATLAFRSPYAAGRYPVSLDGTMKGATDAAALLSVLKGPAVGLARARIINFLPARIAAFTVKENGEVKQYKKERGTWYRSGKTKREMNENIITQFLGIMTMLTAEKFPDNAAGLGTQGKEYIFYDREGAVLADIIFGAEDKEYIKAQFAGKKTLMEFKKDLVDELPL
jgi:hypothetical protein